MELSMRDSSHWTSFSNINERSTLMTKTATSDTSFAPGVKTDLEQSP